MSARQPAQVLAIELEPLLSKMSLTLVVGGLFYETALLEHVIDVIEFAYVIGYFKH